MNIDFDRIKNPHINYTNMKYRLTNPINNLPKNYKDKEPVNNVVSSFRQGIPKQKNSSAKYKTSKNSPDRGTDRSSASKVKNQNDDGSLSKKTTSVNGSNSRFVLATSSKHREKGFESLLKKKIIKMKEKDRENLNSHLHAQTNYLSKIKNKITLDTSLHIKLSQNNTSNKMHHHNVNTQSQKRSNSTLDDDDKYPKPTQMKKNLFHVLTNPGMTQNPFNHQNDIKKSNMASSSKITSLLNSVVASNQVKKPTNSKIHFDFKNTSKTSFPTKHNSRKQSIDKLLKPQIINNQFRGSAIKITGKPKVSSDNTINLLNKIDDKLHLKVLSEVPMEPSKVNDKQINKDINDNDLWYILKKSINFTKKKTTSKSTCRMEENTEIKERVKPKLPVTTCHSPHDHQSKIRKEEKVIENNHANISQAKKSIELEIKEKETKITNENNIPLTNVNHHHASNISIDSVHSTMRECKYYQYEMDLLSNYIKYHYRESSAYPKTKANFYLYGRILGKGAFGKVNLALHVLTGRLVAIKSINKKKLTTEKKKMKILLETQIMKKLKHEAIVQIYETFETEKYIMISMEYSCGGDLLSFIKKRTKLTETIAKFIFKQIIEALGFIHSQNIVHRDIKLDNILMDLDNNVKICDFGVSQIINKGDIMTEQCGTLAYIAPEILKNKGYEGFSVDIWSAGVVLYAMLTGTVPFKGKDMKEIKRLILEPVHPIKDITNEANHLLQSIFEREPKKRITISQILSHPWLINVDTRNKSKVNLFTRAETILLSKSNIDYRNANKDDLIENFTLKNLDSLNQACNKNVYTKSLILAPFNSSMTEDDDLDLKIENNVIKFSAKVIDLNRNYELNNNGEIDNGQIIPLDSNNSANVIKDPSNEDSFSKQISPKPFSPINEIAEERLIQHQKSIPTSSYQVIDHTIVAKVEKLGFKKSYIISSLEANEHNYATASYYLLLKYSNS